MEDKAVVIKREEDTNKINNKLEQAMNYTCV